MIKAILLSAGYGKRLRPITNQIPKCMVSINSKPMIQHWIEKLEKIGVNSFIINTHYLHDIVKNFILNKNYTNVRLEYEDELLGTAGTLIKHINFFNNEDGILVHTDNFAIDDFLDLMECHLNRPKNCLMTMVIFKSNNPSSCGIVDIDDDGIVRNFEEKPEIPKSNLANAAIYILSKELLDEIKDKNYYDFSTEIIPKLLGKIMTYETSKFFTDIGSIESYNQAKYKAKLLMK